MGLCSEKSQFKNTLILNLEIVKTDLQRHSTVACCFSTTHRMHCNQLHIHCDQINSEKFSASIIGINSNKNKNRKNLYHSLKCVSISYGYKIKILPGPICCLLKGPAKEVCNKIVSKKNFPTYWVLVFLTLVIRYKIVHTQGSDLRKHDISCSSCIVKLELKNIADL